MRDIRFDAMLVAPRRDAAAHPGRVRRQHVNARRQAARSFWKKSSTWPRMRAATSPRSSATDFTRWRCRGSSLGGVADPLDLVGGFDRALGGGLDAAGDLLGGGALLGDRGGDGAADVADLADGALDRADRLDRAHRWRAACRRSGAPISSVALAVWPASAFTSLATTAKPRPASPARAASMVALSASRLVCSAMSVMSLTTSPMRPAASLSSLTVALVRSASLTALVGDGVRLRDLPVDLDHRGGKLVGGGRDVAHIGGRLGRGGGGARGRAPRRCRRRRRAGSRPPASDRRCGRARQTWPRRRRRTGRSRPPSVPADAARVWASSSTVRLSSSLRRMASWNTAIERASAPISSRRSP